MIRTVQCTSCSAAFPVDPRKVPDEGVYARCSACQGVFFVEKGMPAMVSAAAVAAPAEDPGFSGGVESGFPSGLVEGFSTGIGSDFSSVPITDIDLVPPSASSLAAEPDSWVFETDPEIDPSTLNVQRLDTIEERMRIAQDDTPSFSKPGGLGAPLPPPPAPAPEPILAAPPPPPPAPVVSAPAEAPAVSKPSAFAFGKRDPHEKAKRLARVLVSDMITYNPERHQKALDAGSLRADFEDEIKRSWGEYVDQIGRELAESTEYFNQALNEILARGQKVF